MDPIWVVGRCCGGEELLGGWVDGENGGGEGRCGRVEERAGYQGEGGVVLDERLGGGAVRGGEQAKVERDLGSEGTS